MTIEIDPLTGAPIIKSTTPSSTIPSIKDDGIKPLSSTPGIIPPVPTSLIPLESAKDTSAKSGGQSFKQMNPPMGRNHSKYTLARPAIMSRLNDAVKISGCDSMQQIKLMKEIESVLDSFSL